MATPPLGGDDLTGQIGGVDDVGHALRDVLQGAQPLQRNGEPVGFHLLFRQAGHHVGGDEAGGDAVDPDVVLGVFVGDAPGEADQSRLGRVVVGLEGLAVEGADRRDIDDAAVVSLLHIGQGDVGAVHGPSSSSLISR